MQLSVGTKWTDDKGQEFVLDNVHHNGAETWVTYTRVSDRTIYNCLAEAFTHRFKEKVQ